LAYQWPEARDRGQQVQHRYTSGFRREVYLGGKRNEEGKVRNGGWVPKARRREGKVGVDR